MVRADHFARADGLSGWAVRPRTPWASPVADPPTTAATPTPAAQAGVIAGAPARRLTSTTVHTAAPMQRATLSHAAAPTGSPK